MKSYFEVIAENVKIPQASKVLLQFWGSEDSIHVLETFKNTLTPKHQQVSTVIFNRQKMLAACEDGPFTISNQVSEIEIQNANVVIDLCSFNPTSLVAFTTETSRPHFVEFMRNHFSAISGPEKLLLQIRIPSEENAMEAGLSLEAYTEIYEKMVLVDYDKMQKDCETLIETYKNATNIIIETGEGHRLTLELEGRPWFTDAGDGDFPAGEVYVAPIENSANGTYQADFIHWEGAHFENVLLTFEMGRLIKSQPAQILDDLKMADENATVIAEFGLGVNPNLQTLTGHSLFDEKIAGSCHIAVGMNRMFGGNNLSRAHIDFVAKNPIIKVRNVR